MGNGESRLEALFMQRKGDPALVYTVEFGSSLDSNSADYLAPASATPESSPAGFTHDRVRQIDSETTTTNTHRFGRVKVDYITPPSE